METGSRSSENNTSRSMKTFEDELKFVPIKHHRSFLTASSQKSTPCDELDGVADVTSRAFGVDEEAVTGVHAEPIKLKNNINNCSTPAHDHELSSNLTVNYFSDDISARISRLNESLRRIKNKEEKSLGNKFSPVSFKLDDLSTLFFDQL